jgi:hypothetical protein
LLLNPIRPTCLLQRVRRVVAQMRPLGMSALPLLLGYDRTYPTHAFRVLPATLSQRTNAIDIGRDFFSISSADLAKVFSASRMQLEF